ncbi:hypothetical protein Tco_1369931 [Tanacetum coccineum]
MWNCLEIWNFQVWYVPSKGVLDAIRPFTLKYGRWLGKLNSAYGNYFSDGVRAIQRDFSLPEKISFNTGIKEDGPVTMIGRYFAAAIRPVRLCARDSISEDAAFPIPCLRERAHKVDAPHVKDFHKLGWSFEASHHVVEVFSLTWHESLFLTNLVGFFIDGGARRKETGVKDLFGCECLHLKSPRMGSIVARLRECREPSLPLHTSPDHLIRTNFKQEGIFLKA